MLEGEDECNESSDITYITDEGMVDIDEVYDGVGQGDARVCSQEQMTEAEVVGKKVEVPVEILGDGDVSFLLFISFY